MSQYKKLIDEAMKTASYRLNAGIDKTASAGNQSSIVKEASELANALEYMSMASVSDGSLAGNARAEMIRDFHKAATAQRLGVKLAGDVGESPTMADGVQLHAPEHGKTRLMPKKEVDGNPMVSASPDSKGKTMLESYKQADSGKTLYDILMHQKEAGDVGEMDASMPAPNIPTSNENSNRSILEDNYIGAGVSKQEAKAPVRDRLAEAFAGTSDTLGDQTVKALFPQAYQKGGLKKTASDVGKLERAKELLTGSKARALYNKQYTGAEPLGTLDKAREYAKMIAGKSGGEEAISEARKSLGTQLAAAGGVTAGGVGAKKMHDKKKEQEKSASYYRLRRMLE